MLELNSPLIYDLANWEQVEPYHRNLFDEIKTLGFLVIIFSVLHVRQFS